MSPAWRIRSAAWSRRTHSAGRARVPFGRCVSAMTAIRIRRGPRRRGPRDPAKAPGFAFFLAFLPGFGGLRRQALVVPPPRTRPAGLLLPPAGRAVLVLRLRLHRLRLRLAALPGRLRRAD